MSKMSEEEIRELLDKYLAPAWLQKRHKTTEVPSYDLHLDEAMRAIHSYTQEKCIEARIDELKQITKPILGKPETPENMDNSTWQGGFRFARNGLSRYKNARIHELKGQL